MKAITDIWPFLQQIQYAKSKSDVIAKLDGTFKMPAAAAGAVTSTELQQSIFNAPPSASSNPTGPTTSTLKPPAGSVDHAMEDARSPTTSTAGQKRRRDEEEDDSEEDVAMEEDSDDE